MLDYEQFKNEIRKETGQILGDRYAVTMRVKRKANLGHKGDLEIFDREASEGRRHILFHLEPYFKKYREGETLHGIAVGIAESCRRLEKRARKTAEDIKDIASFEKCRDRLYFRMVNTSRNREFLADVPHWEMLDLSAVPYILFREDAETAENVMVNSSIAKEWGVSAEDVMKQAFHNAPLIMPAADVFTAGDILKCTETSGAAGRVPELLHILTNIRKVHGFAVVFYPGVLKAAADMFGQNFYILPSSVHEALVVLEGTIPPRELENMVRKVNREYVEEPEVLSDNIYFYDREKDELRMERGRRMKPGRLTVQDCIDMYEKKGPETVIRHGKVVDFIGRKGETYGFSVKVGQADKDSPG